MTDVTPRFKGKKAKKPKRATLRNRADKMFSKLIRQEGHCEAGEWRDGVECEGYLQCAHIIGRGNYRLRWSPLNALCLCRTHHFHYTHRPHDWYAMMSFKYPERFERLRLLAREPWNKDYEKVLDFLKACLEGE